MLPPESSNFITVGPEKWALLKHKARASKQELGICSGTSKRVWISTLMKSMKTMQGTKAEFNKEVESTNKIQTKIKLELKS